MPVSSLSFKRSIWSYSKVQRWTAGFLRGRHSQVRKLDLKQKRYLDLGCGPNTHQNFVNLEYSWSPGIDLCWNILEGIPLPDRSMKGVFTEHCLEHFSPDKTMFILRECFRLIEPGGTLRVIVPDGGLYLATYAQRKSGDAARRFPFEDGPVHGLTSPMIYVNRIFYTDRESVAGHCCMYDAELLTEMLEQAGFTQITVTRFGEGRDPELLIDSPHRAVESLYVEATRPV